MDNTTPRIIISGGGTGGHVFPAISIANALKEINKNTEILFVGAEDRMEMEKVPEAGYEIKGLPVSGVQRKLTLRNLKVPFRLLKSLKLARKIIKQFGPDVVVGVGGYASGPVLRMANKKGIPTLIQEQNSYAGITNRLLAKKAHKICVAYDGMERYFPANKILHTGNPVRKNLLPKGDKKNEALEYFKLEDNKKTILSIGGSLGAQSINESIIYNLDIFGKNNVQLIWQCGKLYHDKAKKELEKHHISNVTLKDFIKRMDLAYEAADLIISRAGAGTISELALVKKPVILVPSPNVAEDHQTRNARSLVDKDAAILIEDDKARERLIPAAIELLRNENRLKELSKNIEQIAKADSANLIAEEVLKLIK
jgi:UDP-N-acetylglucosamine--N-acetylmuramyl-(pentapeptide) pyrophosphoryl-undecaprenol N-acetylglucosamine transferase